NNIQNLSAIYKFKQIWPCSSCDFISQATIIAFACRQNSADWHYRQHPTPSTSTYTSRIISIQYIHSDRNGSTFTATLILGYIENSSTCYTHIEDSRIGSKARPCAYLNCQSSIGIPSQV